MRFSHLMDGDDRWRLPDGRKGVKRPRKIKDVKDRYQSKGMLKHGVGASARASSKEREEVCCNHKKFSVVKEQKEE